jgi:hypothetical protein
MTTLAVRKVHCDRCKRVEEKPLFEESAPPGGVTNVLPKTWTGTVPAITFTATILEESSTVNMLSTPRTVSFQDLCGPCRRTISALLEQIGKKIDGLSPERAPREAKKKEVASSSKATSPNHSASTSHSAAAGSTSGKALSTGMRSS